MQDTHSYTHTAPRSPNLVLLLSFVRNSGVITIEGVATEDAGKQRTRFTALTKLGVTLVICPSSGVDHQGWKLVNTT